MQPLSRQSSGPIGTRFEQRYPGALPCVGKCTQAAYWASANDGYVVVSRISGAQRTALASCPSRMFISNLVPDEWFGMQ